MLTQPPTPQMLAKWRETYRAFRPILIPNRISGEELTLYLLERYPVAEVTNARWQAVVAGNVLENDHARSKLPPGASPRAAAFRVENAGAGRALYERRQGARDAAWRDQPIYAAIDLTTGEFSVEGSAALWDELFAARGLDAADLENVFLVAQYVACTGMA